LASGIVLQNCDLKKVFSLGIVNTLANVRLLTMENGLIEQYCRIYYFNCDIIKHDKRPDGVTKLRYYNNSDIMVISDITD
jgi:hypothetical protein